MSHHKTMELYEQIGTQEKRAVNRLLKAFASGKVEKAELQSICRSISRNTAGSEEAKDFDVHKSRETNADDAQTGEALGIWKIGLSQRFHSDQSGLNLDHNRDRSFVQLGYDDMVQVSGQQSGDKRFASLQVTMHGDPDAPQSRIGPNLSYTQDVFFISVFKRVCLVCNC